MPIGQVITERENGSKRVQIFFEEKSLTEQSHKKKCDINNIMAKYRQTGILPVSTKSPLYGDFTSSEDFHTACNMVIKAREDFEQLPSAIRKRFDNDPGKLVEFLHDPTNVNEAIELGIMEKIGDSEAKPVETAAAAPAPESGSASSGGPGAE